jgi:hypothetical protein
MAVHFREHTNPVLRLAQLLMLEILVEVAEPAQVLVVAEQVAET